MSSNRGGSFTGGAQRWKFRAPVHNRAAEFGVASTQELPCTGHSRSRSVSPQRTTNHRDTSRAAASVRVSPAIFDRAERIESNGVRAISAARRAPIRSLQVDTLKKFARPRRDSGRRAQCPEVVVMRMQVLVAQALSPQMQFRARASVAQRTSERGHQGRGTLGQRSRRSG